MTPKQTRDYLKQPFKCPYCGTDDINAGRPELTNTNYYAKVECEECHEKWMDMYMLTHAYSIED